MNPKGFSVLLLIAGCCFSLLATGAFCAPKPLSLGDVETLLKNGVSSERIAKLVTTHGVSFDLTEREVKKLKSLGAEKKLLDTIRQARAKKPPSGSLFVTSEPSPAEVFLNGVPVGQTPLRLEGLEPGPTELRIGKIEGYDDYVTMVEIKPKIILVFEATLGRLPKQTPASEAPSPSPAVGQSPTETSRLVIDTTPQGARVYVDGTYRGTAPTTIPLSPGKHVLLVMMDSFQAHSEIVTIEEGTRYLSVRLKPR